MQIDLSAIEQWIAPKSRILDLGCGDGSLLKHLKNTLNVNALGVEIDEKNILTCVSQGIHVLEQDLDQGLGNFSDNSFDTVLLAQTLQAVHRPDFVLDEMLRVGKECVITFPNFGHWQSRLSLFFKGKMPVSKSMPYSWYDTPNIHFCTVKDFENLCHAKDIQILNRIIQQGGKKNSWLASLWPNFLGTHAIYHVTR